jgi:hypothetical protein
VQKVTDRGFSLADLTSDDWLARLDEAATERLQRQSSTLKPLVAAAVTDAAQRLKGAASRALSEVVPQVEQWLVENQRNLARYTSGSGDVTPNQKGNWEWWGSQVYRFASDQAEAAGGGRVADAAYAAEAWLLLWEWTPAQWAELSDLTRPGRELRPGNTHWGVALTVGAKVRFARSVTELKNRYNRLTPQRTSFYGSNPLQSPSGY